VISGSLLTEEDAQVGVLYLESERKAGIERGPPEGSDMIPIGELLTQCPCESPIHGSRIEKGIAQFTGEKPAHRALPSTGRSVHCDDHPEVLRGICLIASWPTIGVKSVGQLESMTKEIAGSPSLGLREDERRSRSVRAGMSRLMIFMISVSQLRSFVAMASGFTTPHEVRFL
jgi:hypothetical protein